MLNKNTQTIPPLFISFEGGEGCGKTTQLKLLDESLKQQGIKAIFTREPGGTEDGEAIRNLILCGDTSRWSITEELMMFSASRSKHVREIIKPSLNDNKWVISDRFADSTTVYQGIVQGLPIEKINFLHNMAVGKYWPDLTIVLDIPVEIGLARKGIQADEGLTETRFESHGNTFHEDVRQGFLHLAKENNKRIVVVDASGSIENVQSAIWNEIEKAVDKVTRKQAS